MMEDPNRRFVYAPRELVAPSIQQQQQLHPRVSLSHALQRQMGPGVQQQQQQQQLFPPRPLGLPLHQHRPVGVPQPQPHPQQQQQLPPRPLGGGAAVLDEHTCPVCKFVSKEKHCFHYGGLSCYSCRAFFRRAHQDTKRPDFKCKKNGQCVVTVKTRRKCQKCRYDLCRSVGMEPDQVLSEDQKKLRFRKMLKRKEQETGDSQNGDDDSREDLDDPDDDDDGDGGTLTKRRRRSFQNSESSSQPQVMTSAMALGLGNPRSVSSRSANSTGSVSPPSLVIKTEVEDAASITPPSIPVEVSIEDGPKIRIASLADMQELDLRRPSFENASGSRGQQFAVNDFSLRPSASHCLNSAPPVRASSIVPASAMNGFPSSNPRPNYANVVASRWMATPLTAPPVLPTAANEQRLERRRYNMAVAKRSYDAASDAVQVSPSFIANLQSMHYGRFEVTKPEIGEHIFRMTEQFRRFAMALPTFKECPTGDQMNLLATNTPLFIHYIFARYVTALSGEEQLQWMLEAYMPKNYSVARLQRITLEQLDEHLGLSRLAVDECPKRCRVVMTDSCKRIGEIHFGHNLTPLVANVILFHSEPNSMLENGIGVQARFIDAVDMLRSAQTGSHLVVSGADPVASGINSSTPVERILKMLNDLERVHGTFRCCMSWNKKRKTCANELEDVDEPTLPFLNLPLPYTNEEDSWLRRQLRWFSDAWRRVPAPVSAVQNLVNYSLGLTVSDNAVANNIRLFLERLRNMIKLHPEFTELSIMNQNQLWSRNCMALITVCGIKMEVCETGFDQMRVLLGAFDDGDSDGGDWAVAIRQQMLDPRRLRHCEMSNLNEIMQKCSKQEIEEGYGIIRRVTPILRNDDFYKLFCAVMLFSGEEEVSAPSASTASPVAHIQRTYIRLLERRMSFVLKRPVGTQVIYSAVSDLKKLSTFISRYELCVGNGMNADLVLSTDQKKARFRKLLKKKALGLDTSMWKSFETSSLSVPCASPQPTPSEGGSVHKVPSPSPSPSVVHHSQGGYHGDWSHEFTTPDLSELLESDNEDCDLASYISSGYEFSVAGDADDAASVVGASSVASAEVASVSDLSSYGFYGGQSTDMLSSRSFYCPSSNVLQQLQAPPEQLHYPSQTPSTSSSEITTSDSSTESLLLLQSDKSQTENSIDEDVTDEIISLYINYDWNTEAPANPAVADPIKVEESPFKELEDTFTSAASSATAVSDSLVGHFCNMHRAKTISGTSVPRAELNDQILRLSEVFRLFAKSINTGLAETDYEKLLTVNTPLFVQYVLARYLSADSGETQLHWMLEPHNVPKNYSAGGDLRRLGFAEINANLKLFVKGTGDCEKRYENLAQNVGSLGLPYRHMAVMANLILFRLPAEAQFDDYFAVRARSIDAVGLTVQAGCFNNRDVSSEDILRLLDALAEMHAICCRCTAHHAGTAADNTASEEDNCEDEWRSKHADLLREAWRNVSAPDRVIDRFLGQTFCATTNKALVKLFVDRMWQVTLLHPQFQALPICRQNELWARNCMAATALCLAKVQAACLSAHDQWVAVVGHQFVLAQQLVPFSLVDANKTLADAEMVEVVSLCQGVARLLFAHDECFGLLLGVVLFSENENEGEVSTLYVRLLAKLLKAQSIGEEEIHMAVRQLRRLAVLVAQLAA